MPTRLNPFSGRNTRREGAKSPCYQQPSSAYANIHSQLEQFTKIGLHTAVPVKVVVSESIVPRGRKKQASVESMPFETPKNRSRSAHDGCKLDKAQNFEQLLKEHVEKGAPIPTPPPPRRNVPDLPSFREPLIPEQLITHQPGQPPRNNMKKSQTVHFDENGNVKKLKKDMMLVERFEALKEKKNNREPGCWELFFTGLILNVFGAILLLMKSQMDKDVIQAEIEKKFLQVGLRLNGTELAEDGSIIEPNSIVLVLITVFGRMCNVVGTMKMFKGLEQFLSDRKKKLSETAEKIQNGETEADITELLAECCQGFAM